MEELERIIEALKKGEATSDKDWEAVAEYFSLKGKTDAETITNIERFVLDNFSFEAAAENPYVYFGTDGNANIWQCVDGICKDSANNAVYISSTDAGILFNDDGFYKFLKDNLDKKLFDNVDGIVPLYEGTNASGKITLQAANGESVKVQAFNDFFSENYIKGIKSSNVKTIFSGDILARNGEGLNAA